MFRFLICINAPFCPSQRPTWRGMDHTIWLAKSKNWKKWRSIFERHLRYRLGLDSNIKLTHFPLAFPISDRRSPQVARCTQSRYLRYKDNIYASFNCESWFCSLGYIRPTPSGWSWMWDSPLFPPKHNYFVDTDRSSEFLAVRKKLI